MIYAIIGLSILSGILYRMGGTGGGPWYFNTKMRDFGCPAVCMGGMFLMYHTTLPWWSHVFAFGLLFAALTTYWDFMFKNVDNHWMHGFMCGLSYFPYAIATMGWVGFGVRCIAVAILMGLVSVLSENDIVEEVGRGASLPATLPLLLI